MVSLASVDIYYIGVLNVGAYVKFENIGKWWYIQISLNCYGISGLCVVWLARSYWLWLKE
jgi:hypothetical protein